ncbi:hypothetical protein ACUOCP_05015 [Escherichia sp. R-CC3]
MEWIEALLKKAAKRIPAERLWVNPDCGLYAPLEIGVPVATTQW